MKTIRLTLVLPLTVLALTACSKAAQEKPAPAPPVVAAPVPAPVAPAVPGSTATDDQMKAFTYEQRAGFKHLVTELTAGGAATVVELNRGYNEMLAKPARRAAMAALAKAAADFTGKARALDNVSADTWESVKEALVTCWRNYDGALAKVRETKD